MSPKNAKKANSDPKRDAKSVKEKESEVLPAGGGGADAKDRDGADAAQQKPAPGASAAAAAGAAADASASNAPDNGAADADGDDGDGDGDNGSDADGAEGDDADGEDGLPLAQGAPPEYSVPLDSDSPVYGRYPDAGDDGLPVAVPVPRASVAAATCITRSTTRARKRARCCVKRRRTWTAPRIPDRGVPKARVSPRGIPQNPDRSSGGSGARSTKCRRSTR